MYRCIGCIGLAFASCSAALLTHRQKTAWTEATQCELDALSHLSSFSFSSSLLPSHLAGALIKEAEHVGREKQPVLHTAPNYGYMGKIWNSIEKWNVLRKKSNLCHWSELHRGDVSCPLHPLWVHYQSLQEAVVCYGGFNGFLLRTNIVNE